METTKHTKGLILNEIFNTKMIFYFGTRLTEIQTKKRLEIVV